MHGNRPITLQALLSFVPLFEELGEEALGRIASGTQAIRLPAGQTLFRKNDPCQGIHVVIHGQIKLFFTSAQGIDRVVDILAQGRSHGETQMLADQPHVVSAEALSDSFLLHISKAAILEEFDINPGLRLRLLRLMSSHLHQLIANDQAYSQQSSTQRLIGYLLHQIPDILESDKNVIVTLSTSKANIASLLNLSQEHLSRILHSLSAQGLISVHGKRISIPDLARLKDYRSDSRPTWPHGKTTCSDCNGAAGKNVVWTAVSGFRAS